MRDETGKAVSWDLTEAQEGLWFAQALDPANPILNTGQYLDLTGPLDLAALREAVRLTIVESDTLRLRFAPAGPGAESAARQWLSPDPVVLQELDYSTKSDPASHALRWMQADSARPLDLCHDPLAAFALIRLSDHHHLLYERIHHLAIDGYGMVLVTNRIGEHYSALIGQGPDPLPFPPLSRAFDEDAAYRVSDKRAASALWWREAMADLPEVTGPAPGKAVTGHSFLRESCWLPGDLLARLEAFSDAHRFGWPDVLNALTGAYLARWTGGEAVIGLPFMARMGRSIARVPCMAMNVLPQRITPDEDAPLTEWLAAVLRDMREARKHGLYRSEQLRRDLGLVGGARRLHGPLVNVQPFDRPPVFAGLKVGLNILGAGAVDDLTLTFRGDPKSGILFEVDANPGLYSPADVAGHSARLPAFLDAALRAETLAEVPTASPAEIALIKSQAKATGRVLPDVTLTDLIEAGLRLCPDAPALAFGDRTLTHAEVEAQTAALAARLTALGAGPGKIVAVVLERSLELPLALVAILRTGAAYLPLDPDHPADRIATILRRADPVLTLTSPDLADLLPATAPRLLTGDWDGPGEPPRPASPGDMAYIIFTSGSTGEPKGVVVEHRAIVNRLLWMRDHYGIDASDVILQKTPATFDVSVWEFFLPFLAGAKLVMADPGAHRDPALISAAIRRHQVTTLHFVPSMLSAFLAAPASKGLGPRRVFCSGEELTADQRDRFHQRLTAELHNLYGPTEAAVDVSFWPASPGDQSNPLPIGFPVWNTALLVLDDRMRPVPPGLAGHLYLGGVQLARGYLGRDDLTADRFITHQGQRLYATGDLARLRDDGAVVYLGRSDHQVKIRGLRIELGEIEAAIMASGLARECVVLAREDRAGEKRLVSYVVPGPDYQPGLLARYLATILPGYMVPQAEVALEALPVTSNGKLDRKALPAPELSTAGRPATTPTEQLLTRLYAEVLHLNAPPSAAADFFGLGGDSLSALWLLLRLNEITGRDPGLGAVFERPVIADLAALLDQGAGHDDGLGLMLQLAPGWGAPLFLIHPAGGLGWGYRELARHVSQSGSTPVWALQHPGLDPDIPLPVSLAALARDYAQAVAEKQPFGPIHLAGWSVGGLIAQEMAAELVAMGREVGVLALLDSYPADVWRNEPEPDAAAALRALLAIAGHDPEGHHDLDSREKVVAFLRAENSGLGALPERVLDGVVRSVTDTNRLVRSHHHRRYPGRLTHIRAGLDHEGRGLIADLWADYAGQVEALELPFLHAHMTSAEASSLIGPILAQLIKG